MDDIKKDIKINNNSLDQQVTLLLEEARAINKDIDSVGLEFAKKVEELDDKTNKFIEDIEKLYSELDQIDTAAGTAIDEMLLEQAAILTEN